MKTWLDSAVCAYIYRVINNNVLYPRGLRHFMYMYDKLDFIEGKLPSFAELANGHERMCPMS